MRQWLTDYAADAWILRLLRRGRIIFSEGLQKGLNLTATAVHSHRSISHRGLRLAAARPKVAKLGV